MAPEPTRSKISTSPPDIFHDFEWSETDEPHATRRKLILAKHPEMKKLFGPELMTFPIVVAMVVAQIWLANYSLQLSGFSWLLLAYAVGGTINHAMQLAVHEISHNLAFHTPMYNKLLMIFGNLVTGFPSGNTFQRYHMEHHQYQGVDGVDTDVPTVGEVNFFRNNPALKVLAVFLNPAFYSLRPLYVKPMNPNKWELLQGVVQIAFNVAVYKIMGGWALWYLITGTLLGLGLHPVAGHFISEHYTFVKGFETYSYYGPLNVFAFNVGLHNEHHDFPRIPWSRLWKVREIAPEFYDDLPVCKSWPGCLWDYITDKEVGPYSRVKRLAPTKKSQ